MLSPTVCILYMGSGVIPAIVQPMRTGAIEAASSHQQWAFSETLTSTGSIMPNKKPTMQPGSQGLVKGVIWPSLVTSCLSLKEVFPSLFSAWSVPSAGSGEVAALSVHLYGSSEQMCSAVPGTSIEMNRECCACAANSPLPAAGTDLA